MKEMAKKIPNNEYLCKILLDWLVHRLTDCYRDSIARTGFSDWVQNNYNTSKQSTILLLLL